MPFRRVLVLLLCLVLLPLATSRPASAVEDIARFERITIGPEAPIGECTPYKMVHIYEPSGEWFVCAQDAISYGPITPPGTGGTPGIPGIRSSPTGVDSIHYNTVTLDGICGLLGAISHVNVISGPSGQTCFLPEDPTLLDTPTFYSIVATDANPLTLAPWGSQLLNGLNAPLPSIRGPRARYKVEWRGDEGWYADVVSAVGYGEPWASVCSEYGGSTNTSSSGSGSWHTHTLNCLLPANSLTERTTLNVCVGEQAVTGSTAPTSSWRLLANATVLLTNTDPTPMTINRPATTIGTCFRLVIGSVPGASASVSAHMLGDFNSVNSGTISSSTATPVAVDTTVDVVLGWETKWATAGVGTNSRTQNWLTVEGARFAQ